MKGTWIVMAAILAAATAAQAATPEAREAYRGALKHIAVDHNKARALCRSLAGHPRRVCFAEAEADAKKATANAAAEYRDTAQARRDARISEANANYALARVKCADKSGDERRECIKVAKAMQSDAISGALKEKPVK